MKKLISILLSAILLSTVICAAPFTVSAAVEETEVVGASSGTTGDCTWTLDDNGTLIISGNGNMGDYSVKNQNDSWITTAPWGANIKSVVIESGVTNIGACAFYGCTGLTSVTIPDSVTNIAEYAFYNCKSIKTLTLPQTAVDNFNKLFSDSKSSIEKIYLTSSVTSISNSAFFGCTGLESITIPDSVTSIDSSAFHDCTSLNSVFISDIASWCKIQFSGYNSNPLYYAHNLYLNDELITDLVIPDNVTSIGAFAFNGCRSIESVTISDSVTSIGGEAFRDCTSLDSITIPDSVTSISSYVFYNTAWFNNQPNGVVYAGKVAYTYKGTMPANTSIVFREGTKGIADSAFRGRITLESITIPEGVTSIGEYAFYGCTRLSSATIPDSVTSIGNEAFYNCSLDLYIICNPGSAAEEYSLNNYIYKSSYERTDYYYLYCKIRFFFEYKVLADGNVELTKYNGSYKNVDIPSSYNGKTVTSLGSWLFANDTKLENVIIPDSVTNISKGAFYNCVELKTVTMGKNVTEIGANAFEKCLYLENINLSDNLQTIGDEAFYDCRRLKTLDIPATVTSIGEEAFTNCRSLQSLTIPKGVNKLGDESSLGYGMFENCQNLTEVKIPKTVSYIQSNAFDGCKNLTIAGAPDSYAKSFAENNNIPFRAVVDDAPIGDSNGDGNVDVLDAAAIQKFASGMADMTNDQQYFADVNNDGVVDILDAAEIQKFAAGIITEFKKKG